MRFEAPEYLLFFLLLLGFFALWTHGYRSRRVALNKSFSKRNQEKLGISSQVEMAAFLSRCFLLGSLAFLAIALSRPQSGHSSRDEISAEYSVIFLVDVSKSMLSRDIAPSRLELTKREIAKAMDAFEEIKVGLVAFAGASVVISPVTSDHSAIQVYLESLFPSTVSSQGTEILSALSEAREMFKRVGKNEEKFNPNKNKVIVLFSDGENHEQESIDFVDQLADEGFRIFSVGVGSINGGFIPESNTAKTFIKGADGQVVVSKPNFEFLKSIAKKGRGAFYHLRPASPLFVKLKNDLLSLAASEKSKRKFIVKKELFQIPMCISLLLLCLSFVLSRRPLR